MPLGTIEPKLVLIGVYLDIEVGTLLLHFVGGYFGVQWVVNGHKKSCSSIRESFWVTFGYVMEEWEKFKAVTSVTSI